MPWIDGLYTTTVTLVGEVFKSEVEVTITMKNRGSLTQGETDVVVDAVADSIGRDLDKTPYETFVRRTPTIEIRTVDAKHTSH